MTWQEKFMALRALGGSQTAIHARDVDDWYVRIPYVSIGGDGLLESPTQSGDSPESAVLAAWIDHTALKPGHYLVIEGSGTPRRQVRWNGFMWDHVPVEPEVQP